MRADRLPRPVREDSHGERRPPVPGVRGSGHLPHVRRDAGNAQQPGLVVQRLAQVADRHAAFRLEVEQQPGIDRPAARPIISPSSGVKPIEVSTDTPFLTAVTDAPLPRWATTHRKPSSRRAISAARPAQYPWLNPWNPNRRRPHRSVQSNGSG